MDVHARRQTSPFGGPRSAVERRRPSAQPLMQAVHGAAHAVSRQRVRRRRPRLVRETRPRPWPTRCRGRGPLRAAASPKVANISNPGMNATSNHDTRSEVNTAEGLSGITNCHRSAQVCSQTMSDPLSTLSFVTVGETSADSRQPPSRLARLIAEVGQRDPPRSGPPRPPDESHTGAGLSACLLRAGLHQSARADGRHHPVGAEHRQAGQPHHPGVVQAYRTALDYAQADRTELEELDPAHRLLPQQGQLADPARPGTGRAVRRPGAATPWTSW